MNTVGTLRGWGTIDLTQFWPQNILTGNRSDSDADTVKVELDPARPFEFVSATGARGNGNVLFDAGFRRKDKKQGLKFQPTIKTNKAGHRVLTIRLQGIDAPELHYPGVGATKYRQRMAETSTVQLYKFLKSHSNSNLLECELMTHVNKPNDVFDTYGRFVGDILIRKADGSQLNVNHWLLEFGYAFPSFYDSMLVEEIRAILALAAPAKKKLLNVWDYYSGTIHPIDQTVVHNTNDPQYNAPQDKKPPVINPKFFRRVYTFELEKKNPFTPRTFRTFLLSNPSTANDKFYETKQFLALKKKAPKQRLGRALDAYGHVLYGPHELVFTEKPTLLRDSQGEPITSF